MNAETKESRTSEETKIWTAIEAYEAHSKTEQDEEYGGVICSECGWSLSQSGMNYREHAMREALGSVTP